MDNEVIITIRCGDKFEEDFEVPVNLKIEKWITPVEDYLKQKDVFEFSGEGHLFFAHNGERISERNTLQELSIWDGAILDAGLL